MAKQMTRQEQILFEKVRKLYDEIEVAIRPDVKGLPKLKELEDENPLNEEDGNKRFFKHCLLHADEALKRASENLYAIMLVLSGG